MADSQVYRDPVMARRVADKIQALTPKTGTVKICHVCGTHEWTISHFGIRSLLPKNIEVIAGPGCPVCILPASEVDAAIQMAKKDIVSYLFWGCSAGSRQPRFALGCEGRRR